MSTKQSSSDKSTGNGGNTAVYISSSAGGKQADADLKSLAEICFKSTNPLTLFCKTGLKSEVLQELLRDSKIKPVDGNNLGDDIKNVIPLKLPLSNEPELISRWAMSANKAYNGSNMVAAFGRPSSKTGIAEKYYAYWANFWPKLYTGANTNLSSCEVVMLNPDAFRSMVVEGSESDAWQLAAAGEKAGLCTKVPFEYQPGDFVFGDGIKAFFSAPLKGIKTIYNSFFRLLGPVRPLADKSDINHRIWKRAFGIGALLLLLTMAFISPDYNITWDEPNHNTFSKDVLKYYTSLGDDTTMFDFQKEGHRDYFTNVYYGMSIDVAAAAISSITGAENDYLVRHFLNSIIGFLSILFAALIVRLFSGWLPALLTLLVLACSPSFFGHCFNNPKDIPFAAGYIMALYYLLRLMKEFPNPGHQTKVLLAIAIGFALSIRAGGLLLFGILGLAFLMHWLLFSNRKSGLAGSLKPYLIQGLIVAVAGYCIGIAMWPYALRQPLTGAITALKEFEKFSYLTYYELFEGVRVFNKPWYYEPKLIMLTAPLAVLGGFILSLLLAWFRKSKLETAMLFMLVFATIFPAFWAIYKKSYVYNGWRHFIFIYPSMAALAVLGWYWLARVFRHRLAVPVMMGLLGLSLIKPGIWGIVNHPYQYMYFNEIAGGIEGANGEYELDYWNQTPREAFEWLIKNRPEVLSGNVKVSSNNIQESLKSFVPEGKDVKYAWTREYEWTDNDWTYAIWTTRTLSRNQIKAGYWPPKGTIHEVKVGGITVAAVVQSANQYSHMGKRYLKKNMGDSALYFYRQAFAYNPLEEEYARGLADACKLKMNLDSAELFYKKAIALRDGNYEAYQSLGEVYYTRAMMLNQQNPDKALMDKAYENLALAFKHKKNASAPLIMGEIRLQQNNAAEAKDHFNQFLQVYGNVGRGYLGLGKSQLMLGETDSAYYNLQAAIQLDPKNPEAYYILGTELQKSGRAKEAEQFLNEYMKLSGMGAAPQP